MMMRGTRSPPKVKEAILREEVSDGPTRAATRSQATTRRSASSSSGPPPGSMRSLYADDDPTHSPSGKDDLHPSKQHENQSGEGWSQITHFLS